MKAIDVLKEQIDQGIILVRKDGKFWKISNKLNHKKGIIPIDPKRMEVNLKSGYLGVVVWKDGKQYLMLAHRAMWEIFVGEIPDKMDINHKNGNKKDNRLENLEVVSRKQNLNHAIKMGLKTYSNYPEKYSERAKEMRNEGMSFSEIAKALGISQTTAFHAVNFVRTH